MNSVCCGHYSMNYELRPTATFHFMLALPFNFPEPKWNLLHLQLSNNTLVLLSNSAWKFMVSDRFFFLSSRTVTGPMRKNDKLVGCLCWAASIWMMNGRSDNSFYWPGISVHLLRNGPPFRMHRGNGNGCFGQKVLEKHLQGSIYRPTHCFVWRNFLGVNFQPPPKFRVGGRTWLEKCASNHYTSNHLRSRDFCHR